MKYKYDPQNFSDLYATDLGQTIWRRLTTEKSVDAMKLATKLARPAVAALDEEALLDELGPKIRTRRVKQMIGHMVRQVMEAAGYKHRDYRVPIRGNKVFSTASRYHGGS